MWKDIRKEKPMHDQLVVVYDGGEKDFSKYSDNGWCCPDDLSGAIYRDGDFWYGHPDNDNSFTIDKVTLWMPANKPEPMECEQ